MYDTLSIGNFCAMIVGMRDALNVCPMSKMIVKDYADFFNLGNLRNF